MKKSNIILSVFLAVMIAMNAILIALLFQFSTSTANKVFAKTIDSVVELRASNDNSVEYGTAIAISKDSLITNAHVITSYENGDYVLYDNIEFGFYDSETYIQVNVIDYDMAKDLAYLSSDKLNLNEITLSDKQVAYGDEAYVIGNGMNYGLSMKRGIISIPSIEVICDGINGFYIQADISVCDGDSGGALLDKEGKLIGIPSFRLKDANGNVIQHVCYSIPVSVIREYIALL